LNNGYIDEFPSWRYIHYMQQEQHWLQSTLQTKRSWGNFLADSAGNSAQVVTKIAVRWRSNSFAETTSEPSREYYNN
jgi:hypothetical protein